MNEDVLSIKTGHFDVGDGHKLYYQQWGNPKGIPIFALHGGPGSASRDKHKLAFDPKKHCVTFFDQRGAGQSTAKDPLHNNTIETLAADIEKLRKHFGYTSINVFGHSWGSTLALYYAINYPKSVKKLIIGGVYTATRAETENLYQGGLKHLFPEAWERYLEVVPENRRDNTLGYYEEVFTSGTQAEKLKHIQHWSQLEPTPMSIDADYLAMRQAADSINTLDDLPSIMVSIHYFRNDCFMPEGYILENLKKIQHIPTVIIQGRFDTVTAPEIAYHVARNMGDNCHLHFVPASHKGEGSLREVQRAYVWSFFTS